MRMQINLYEVKSKCASRGKLPDACRGCPANPDGNTVPADKSGTVYARCELGFPRSWKVSSMENTIYGLLHAVDKPKPACYKCASSMFEGGMLVCTQHDHLTPDKSYPAVLLEYYCDDFEPSAGYKEEFTHED